jgi:hypothetical protein
MADKYPMTKQEFDSVYSKVPRLTVEVIVKNQTGAIYLTKRAIEPCKGQWHLPGGTVYFGEPLLEAVNRLGIRVLSAINKGYIEYPSHYKNGLDSPVGMVFEVTKYEGKLKIDDEAIDADWFTLVPDNIHADQDIYLIENKYLKSN